MASFESVRLLQDAARVGQEAQLAIVLEQPSDGNIAVKVHETTPNRLFAQVPDLAANPVTIPENARGVIIPLTAQQLGANGEPARFEVALADGSDIQSIEVAVEPVLAAPALLARELPITVVPLGFPVGASPVYQGDEDIPLLLTRTLTNAQENFRITATAYDENNTIVSGFFTAAQRDATLAVDRKEWAVAFRQTATIGTGIYYARFRATNQTNTAQRHVIWLRIERT